jgi:hypothetical protein
MTHLELRLYLDVNWGLHLSLQATEAEGNSNQSISATQNAACLVERHDRDLEGNQQKRFHAKRRCGVIRYSHEIIVVPS